MKVKANGLDIEVEDSGPVPGTPQRPVVLLIMGLGMQLVAWPMALVQALVDAGYRVVRHDNRDIGLSQYFDHLGVPNIPLAFVQHKLSLTPRAPYQLGDMAQDSLGVLDALGIEQAHIVGASMGGMIAQRMALRAPQRCLSLTSVMSSSSARGLPEAKPAVWQAMMQRPRSFAVEDIVQHYIRLFNVIGSPGYRMTDAQWRDYITLAANRSWHPQGMLRQFAAVGADVGKRAVELGRIRVPTLVLHGKADPLLPFAHGQDTARRIPGAQLQGIDGMGHDLPPGVLPLLLQHMLPFWAQHNPRATR